MEEKEGVQGGREEEAGCRAASPKTLAEPTRSSYQAQTEQLAGAHG